MLLDIDALRVRYGPITAVDGVSINVDEGEIVALVGANGAGKSSLLRSIIGLAPVSSGSITSPQGELRKRSTHWIARHTGIAYVPEDRGVFTRMSVRENLEMGAYTKRSGGPAGIVQALQRMYELFPRLAERKDQASGTLSGGEQQMLAIGRALISSPRVLLLDEPSLGLAPIIVADIFDRLDTIRQQGTSVLLVEQNSRLALEVASRAYVMDRGRIVMSGPSAELALDDGVRQAYLGLGGQA